MRAVQIAAATVAIALLSAGCGGDDGSGASAATTTPTPESTPETPTKAAYVKQVNAFCSGKGNAKARKAGSAIDSAIARAGKDLNAALESGADAGAILDRVGRLHVRLADNLDAAIRRIKAMPAPADGGATGFLSAFARDPQVRRRGAEDGWPVERMVAEVQPKRDRNLTRRSPGEQGRTRVRDQGVRPPLSRASPGVRQAAEPVRTRLLTAEDTAFMERMMLLAAFPPDRELPPAALEMAHVRRFLDGWGRRPGDVGVVAIDDAQRELGAAWARVLEEPLLYDDTGAAVPELAIAVEPDARSEGIGGALLDALADAARNAGHRELSLRVSPRNPAERLYRRREFEPAREAAGELIMRRRLV